MGKIKNLLNSNKFKYGALAVVFVAVFIALVIGFNLVVSFLDAKYNLRIDLTKSQIYMVSQASDDALKVALGDKYSTFDITITFCADRDMFNYYDSYNSEVKTYYSSVRDIAEEYSRIYDGNGKGKVTVKYIDVTSDPAGANRIKQQVQLSSINWTNIIIQNNLNLNYYRVLGFDAFYASSMETGRLYAIQAENRYAASIIQCVVAENITVAFTKGHSESHSSQLESIFTLSTLNIVTLDLKKDDIPEDVSIIVVSNPLYDFTFGENGEIDKISDHLSDKTTYNSLIVLVNANTPDLPNLRDYLSQQWGLDYLPNHKLTDESNSVAGSKFEALYGVYSPGDTSSAAYYIHKTASDAGVRTIFNNAVELKADLTGLRNVYVEVSIFAHSTAMVTYEKDGAIVTEPAPGAPLLAISTFHTYANDDFNYNANKYQYVMLVGSTDFASDKYLTTAYGNKDIVYAATRAMATDRVALNIGYKTFEKSALSLSSGTSRKLMILVTCAIPSLIIIIGVAVFLKRRHL